MKRTFQSISAGLFLIVTRRRLSASSVLLLCLLSTVLAQGEQSGKAVNQSTAAVTAAATNERVRFTAPSNVVRMQLQIISESGQVLFDVSSKGNVLDWTLQDSSGQRLQGSYLTVVTVKSLSGRVSERIGSVSVAEQQVELKAVEATRLTPAQQQAVGPIEESATLTILKGDEAQPVTVLANDGKDGQLVRERGALSFRLGDFYSGNDQEQMRLTEEGNLGIGTAKPKARLDVSGAIRAREGFMFADGSTLKINEKGVLTRTSADGITPSAVNSTQNQIAKFTDNAGTMGDSAMTETGGQVGIGTAAPASLLHLAGPSGVSAITLNTPGSHRFRFQTVPGVPNWGALTLNANYNAGWFLDEPATNGWFFKLDTRGGNANGPNNGLWLFRIPSGPNPHTDEGPVFGVSSGSAYFAGNLGIGTLTPSSKLTVAGLIETSTGGIKFPDGTIQSTAGGGGGGNAILNQTTQQAGANFNIGGTGAANAFDATQYNIGGQRVLSAGSGNIFAGVGAGQANTAGTDNSFFGRDAGLSNTTGEFNSFFGRQAGESNIEGYYNAFFGGQAGQSNTAGYYNAFFGGQAGHSNTTGIQNAFFGFASGPNHTTGQVNTFVGDGSGPSNTVECCNTFIGAQTNGAASIENATAIGFRAKVSQSNSLVLGSIAGVNSAPVSTNVGIGTTAPTERLHVVGNGLVTGNLTVNGTLTAALPTGSTNYIQNSTSQQSPSNFNISGNGTAGTLSAGVVSAASQYNIGGSRVLSVVGTNNVFVGMGAGQATTTSDSNSFFGANAGVLNTGNGNSFFGKEAGKSNTTGSFNSFFGTLAGQSNTLGEGNSFFGIAAGYFNDGGFNNSFFGRDAGHDNTTGTENSFFGGNAGGKNLIGVNNSFFGSAAGFESTGDNNSFFGRLAGQFNTTGFNNTMIGFNANVGSGNLTNATAIGANATADVSNSLVLGNNINVGIGTSSPETRLHVKRDADIGASWTNAQLRISGGDSNKQLNLGYDTTNNRGVIQAGEASIAFRELLLNPNGGNVGIGTNTPNARLQVTGGDAAIDSQGNGLILRATTGPNCYRLTVDGAGNLATALVTCP